MKQAFGMIVVGVVGAASAMLAGCSITNSYGVDIQNRTGQNLLVEFLDINSDGTTRVYSTARLSPKGAFSNRVTDDEQGYGKRVRFSLPDRGADDTGARLELKLSDEKSRYYDLTLKNGRLVADEFMKGREPTASSDLLGGSGQ